MAGVRNLHDAMTGYAPENLFAVAGKVALITGGGSGIGLMIAQCLTANGARVYICGRNAEKLEEAAGATGATAIAADISTLEGIEHVRRELGGREERLDILVNNAGTSWVSAIDEFPEHGWDKVLDLNAKAPFFLVKALLPLLSRQPDGAEWSSVVMISSARGMTAKASSVAYNVSKAALNHMTRVLAVGLADHRISVNTIAPGWFETNLNRTILRDRKDDLLSAQPIKRLGSAEDLSGAILFLCSRAGAYVTGHILPLDGGLVAAA
ncbi:SDR family oxidoreductase [Sphingobium sp. SCG-1]|uniref:SDR family oxidoreductase n=1 Tax=Sphingobium sp. SCG-1 TaxID=2072936 RepID=UPI00167120AE|nr:SDR family oxidoreductase [Sphingobium sp. SCG-1]